MLDTEGQWSEALASNNVRAIIRWLRWVTAEGEFDVEEMLPAFSCWVQRTSEFAKKELLTLCFSRCQGLWMFLDRSSFTRVHMLLRRLRNLLTLAEWARRQLTSAHLWHGAGVPCEVCGDTLGSSDVRRGCWSRERRALKQHIWLGQLVQWFGITGLLPKYPEAHESKRISQMWRGMENSHQKSHLDTLGREEGGDERWSSFILGMVMELDTRHGRLWTSEACGEQRYPPPSLQALLKLVLVPRIDNMSVQAFLMYFILDVTNFLQCKDDLLQSFCHAFTIPAGFSQQTKAFWMLDHGQVAASMELLLSPRAAVPRLPWQHRCVFHQLLARKQPRWALRYLHWTGPAVQSAEDAKLCAEVLLQNSRVSDAWALLRRSHAGGDDALVYFSQACDRLCLRTEALKYIPAGCDGEGGHVNGINTTGSQSPLVEKAGGTSRPLSAELYQAQGANTASPEELVRLVQRAATDARSPRPQTSEVAWPEHTERKPESRGMFLSARAPPRLTPSFSPTDMIEHTEDEEDEEEPLHDQHHETHKHTSSSEDLGSASVSSSASASHLPLSGRSRPHVYESTATLQRISSLLTDSKNRSTGDGEEESRPPSSSSFSSSSLSSSPPADVLTDRPELTLTPDGATDLSSPNRGFAVDPGLSEEEGDDVGSVVDAASIDEAFALSERSEVSQTAPPLCEPQVEGQGVLSPDFGVTDLWSLVLPPEEPSGRLPPRIFSFSEATESDCFAEGTLPQHQQEEEDLSRSLLTDLHPAPPSEEEPAAGGEQDSGSVLTPVCGLISNSPAPCEAPDESPHEARLKTETETFVQSCSARPDHVVVGCWWKRDAETWGASGGLSPAAEPGAAFTSDNPLVLRRTHSYSLLPFMDKGDGKQADKEQPAGWSPGTASQGAIRNGRTRSRKGKGVKRT